MSGHDDPLDVPAGSPDTGGRAPDDADGGGPEGTGRRNLIIALGAVLAALVVVLVVVLVTRDDDEEVTTTSSSTTTTSEVTSSTTGATSTTESTSSTSEATSTTSPGGVTDEEARTIVWPDPGGSTSYGDPLGAARSFVVDLIGFTDPVIGEYQGGDSRSGEFEVRAQADGPVTTVFVRQMSDDNWYVLGAVTDEIQLDEPTSGSTIDSPLQVSGQARAFEGTVRVAVYERGGTSPLGEGFVTGSGGEDLGPFSGEIDWENPGGGSGVVVLRIDSAEDGRVWQAAATPVGFAG